MNDVVLAQLGRHGHELISNSYGMVVIVDIVSRNANSFAINSNFMQY